MRKNIFWLFYLILLPLLSFAQSLKHEDFIYSKRGAVLLQQTGDGSGFIRSPTWVYFNNKYVVVFLQKDTLLFENSNSGYSSDNKDEFVINCFNSKGDGAPALRLTINYKAGYFENGVLHSYLGVDFWFMQKNVRGAFSIGAAKSDTLQIKKIKKFIDRNKKKFENRINPISVILEYDETKKIKECLFEKLDAYDFDYFSIGSDIIVTIDTTGKMIKSKLNTNEVIKSKNEKFDTDDIINKALKKCDIKFPIKKDELGKLTYYYAKFNLTYNYYNHKREMFSY